MNESDVFQAALEIADASERARLLDELCGDDAGLRQSVESRLASHAAAERRLGPDAGQGESADSKKPVKQQRILNYRLIQRIGSGGNGTVFRAFDEQLQRVVALKLMARELTGKSPARKRFMREARAAASLRHPAIVNIYSVQDAERPFLTMEFIEGHSLQDKLDEEGPFDWQEVCRLGIQIADGLSAAHDQSLLHRDIKPANLLIERESGDVKITDFGLARSVDDASLTRSGMIAGTPMYMSPEQASGTAIDHRSDLFSLGSVLYTMLTGRPPFRAPHPLAVMRRLTEEQPREIRELIPEVPQSLVDVVGRLHQKSPDDRIQHASEVASALREIRATPSPTPQPTTQGTTETQPESSKALSDWILVGVLIVLACAWGLVNAFSVDGGGQVPSIEKASQTSPRPAAETAEPESAEPTETAKDDAEIVVSESAVLLGADVGTLRQWLSGLGDLVPLAAQVRVDSGDPRLDAIALRLPRDFRWKANFIENDREAGDDFQRMRKTHGIYWRITIPEEGKPPAACAGITFWRTPSPFWETRNRLQTPIDRVITGLRESGRYAQSLCIVQSAGVNNTHVMTTQRPKVKNIPFASLTVDEFTERAADLRGNNWFPQYFQLHSGGTELLIAGVFCENALGIDWDLSTGLSEPQFWELRAAKQASGYYPRSLASYREDGQVKLIVLWHDVWHHPWF